MKRLNVRQILVPIDFSKLSKPAIEMAKGLAGKFEASVHLAHVHEFFYPSGFIVPAPLSMQTYYANAGERLADELKALAKRNGLSAENSHLLSGTPTFNEICNLARMIPADLIVMPTHGYTGITHFFAGSTAQRIVQHSPCPVFVTRKRDRKSARVASNGKGNANVHRILVAVDFSASSFQALEYAIGFAERIGASLIVFHAVHLGDTFSIPTFSSPNLSVVTEAARKEAERQMKEFVQLAKFGRVKFETIVRSGRPVAEICEFAAERKVDLITVATHGRTAFKELLIGSVAERVVQRARCSVLVVPSYPEVRTHRLSTETRRAAKTTDPRGTGHSSPTTGERLRNKVHKAGRASKP